MRLVGAGLRENAVDDRQDLARLLGDAGAGRLVGDLPRDLEGVAVEDGGRHARADADALNGHAILTKLAILTQP
jgi:hypothetical protein